jgi:hypothetical protein
MNVRKKLLGLGCASLLLFSLTACDLVGQEPIPTQLEPMLSGRTEAEETAAAPAETAPAAEEEQTEQAEPAEETQTAPPEETAGGGEAEPEPEDAPEQETGSEPGEEAGEAGETGSEAEPPEPDPNAVTPPPSAGVAAFELSGPAMLGETADQGQDYVDRMIFLGDSTTYGMKYYAVLSGGKNTQQVWTPSNGTLTLSYQGFASIVYPPDGSEIPIRDAVRRALPEYMVITLGVNGISFMDEQAFKSEYRSLVTDIQSISPDTKIILQSIFPVASNYEYLSSINNDKISAANQWVLDIAEECGVRYLNTASVLVGEDGWLPQNLQNGDGLHLNEIGFGIVLAYIRTHGYQ